ncbi:MAG: hypothetical protein AB1668_05990 [Nanoarchaeota archaeon]
MVLLQKDIIKHTEVELDGKKYFVYLKEVPTKLAIGGAVERTAVKAFVKRLNLNKKSTGWMESGIVTALLK